MLWQNWAEEQLNLQLCWHVKRDGNLLARHSSSHNSASDFSLKFPISSPVTVSLYRLYRQWRKISWSGHMMWLSHEPLELNPQMWTSKIYWPCSLESRIPSQRVHDQSNTGKELFQQLFQPGYMTALWKRTWHPDGYQVKHKLVVCPCSNKN